MPHFILSAQNFTIYDGDGLDPYARTGELRATHLRAAGAEGVILGHSEVGDSPAVVHAKLRTCLQDELLPKSTLLVGESWEEYEAQGANVDASVSRHLAEILTGIPATSAKDLVVGYEPKWGSRGSGRDDMPPPDPSVIGKVARKLRETLVELYGAETGGTIPLIYGGRSTPERTREIMSDDLIEGLILGSACNSVQKTMEIASAMDKIRPGKRKILHANFKAYDLPDTYESYLYELRTLDDSFIIYFSPAHTNLRELHLFLNKENE